MRVIFFDLETGGLDPAKHPIIQIAAIAVDEQLNELAEFEAKILFKLENADQEALLKNCYDREVWEREGKVPAEVCSGLSMFFKRYADVAMKSKAGKPYSVAQLIGHNSDSFDGPFLQQWYKRLDQFMPAAFRTLCTYQRALHHFHERPDLPKPENFKLEGLCRYFGIPLSNAHDAMADCRATLNMYRALRGVVASNFETASA
jgi:DNA polymerase-3 subunit epsilon